MSKLLIVDDEYIIAFHLQEILTRAGHQVVGMATSGEEGMRLARETGPEIVLMDIVMPGKLNGIEAADRIVKELNLPVVFITAHSDKAMMKKAEKIPNHGYIVKPFQPDRIIALIDRI